MLIATDPLSLRVEHVILDAYALRNGYVFITLCNYPEAFLAGELIINNYTVVTTTDRKFVANPSVMYYAGPGNVTALNMDYTDTYVTILNPKASFYGYYKFFMTA